MLSLTSTTGRKAQKYRDLDRRTFLRARGPRQAPPRIVVPTGLKTPALCGAPHAASSAFPDGAQLQPSHPDSLCRTTIVALYASARGASWSPFFPVSSPSLHLSRYHSPLFQQRAVHSYATARHGLSRRSRRKRLLSSGRPLLDADAVFLRRRRTSWRRSAFARTAHRRLSIFDRLLLATHAFQ